MASFQQNDVTIYFEQHGKGPDLVLIAGLSADVSFWQKMLPILSQHYRVTVLGHMLPRERANELTELILKYCC